MESVIFFLVAYTLLILPAVPLIFFPKECARMRYRHAQDPEPTPWAVWEMRLTGLFYAVIVLVVAASELV